MADIIDKWATQARKGILELAVLTSLDGAECYAYELVKKLLAISGLGITEGTIYPLLSRLRSQGLVQARLVESSSGPARKYYSLTEQGKQALELMQNYLDTLLAGVDKLREDTELYKND